MKKVKILIVDDSALIRNLLSKHLPDDQLEVIGTARDPYHARDLILQYRPDVMTLDVQMPRMNGVDFLKKLMPQFPIPTIMVSAHTESGALTTIDALDAGAVDFAVKPNSNSGNGIQHFVELLRTKIKIAATVDVSGWKNRNSYILRKRSRQLHVGGHGSVVVMGASTGGTEALHFVISRLPQDFPPVVVVQHMPSGFTKAFADRLNRSSKVLVVEGKHHEELSRGKVIIAPGGIQCTVGIQQGKARVFCESHETIDGHCPSVTNLFSSAAECFGERCLGVIMTGMGRDGADGMVKLKSSGSYNIAQDAQSCVVYGMPRAAVEKKAVDLIVPLENIASKMIDYFRK